MNFNVNIEHRLALIQFLCLNAPYAERFLGKRKNLRLQSKSILDRDIVPSRVTLKQLLQFT